MSRDETRFWVKVDKSGECWTWKAQRQGGYGRFQLRGRNRLAHTVAYEWLVGPVPVGLQIDHLCRNRACVNPAHMEPVTSRENTLRGATIPARQVAKTHCPMGHPYSGDNLRIRPTGARACRACHRRASQLWCQRHPGARRASLLRYRQKQKEEKAT